MNNDVFYSQVLFVLCFIHWYVHFIDVFWSGKYNKDYRECECTGIFFCQSTKNCPKNVGWLTSTVKTFSSLLIKTQKVLQETVKYSVILERVPVSMGGLCLTDGGMERNGQGHAEERQTALLLFENRSSAISRVCVCVCVSARELPIHNILIFQPPLTDTLPDLRPRPWQ